MPLSDWINHESGVDFLVVWSGPEINWEDMQAIPNDPHESKDDIKRI